MPSRAKANYCIYCKSPVEIYKGLSDNPSHWQHYCTNEKCKTVSSDVPTEFYSAPKEEA